LKGRSITLGDIPSLNKTP